MAIIKKSYEISVWDEKLGENGQKTEIKRAVIGADDMTYLGRATSPKFTKNLNGTHTLTFQLPSKFFDSEKGEYVRNEFCDYLFNERKVKLKHDGEWYEFYVKNITENKQFKSIMYQYTCEDAFIDELSRNGYGITFDTELYNNVEEIGTFTETILEDSIWEYDASKNWGDFTEYSEEKLFKIPIKMFGGKISGYKLNYQLKTYKNKEENNKLKNVFTGEERFVEMGDDIAREQKQFWDNGSFDKGIELLSANNYIEDIPNDGYVYIPYSCLSFCYSTKKLINRDDVKSITSTDTNYKATESALSGKIKEVTSYFLSPDSMDPNYLIQFIVIPKGAEVQIDESGLLVDKNYSYIMTLEDWNNIVNTDIVYNLEDKIVIQNQQNNSIQRELNENRVVCYEGYLEKIGDTEVTFGKKISITDRTEINITEEIDQYVTVYNNKADEDNLINLFTAKDWKGDKESYRICSYDDTRMIVPQLARNLIQNGTNMSDTSGWEVMKLFTKPNEISSSIYVRINEQNNELNNESIKENPSISNNAGLIFNNDIVNNTGNENYQSFVNFGIVGQEEIISKNQTYVLKFCGCFQQETSSRDGKIYKPISYTELDGELELKITIGEGEYDDDGDYKILNNSDCPCIQFTYSESQLINGNSFFIKPTIDIKNPYISIYPVIKKKTNNHNIIVFNLQEAKLFKAYTKGKDFFKESNPPYKYSGRDIFFDYKDKQNTNGWEKKVNYYYKIAKQEEYLSENDIMEGDAYTYKRYFIQQAYVNDGSLKEDRRDITGIKSLLHNNVDKSGFNPEQYTLDDITIVTNYIDLNKCKYYLENGKECDCGYNTLSSNIEYNKICMYQKYGYCPYLFKTQKHCRKIRTLSGEKSNRFNLTQELSKVFEIYPIYYTEHLENGKIITDNIDKSTNQITTDFFNSDTMYKRMRKKVFYITEKGQENKLGFRYEKNLSNISRTFDSKEIVTKLYVEDVDSELSKTGLCSIKTAEDNPSKDSYIIDFSYYIMRGILDEQETNADLYGIDNKDMGYLKQLGYYNTKYDELSNIIINLQNESYTELTANIEVNLTGIETALKELNKIKKNLSKYVSKKNISEENDTYLNYKTKYIEQKNILYSLIEDTFFTNGKALNCFSDTESAIITSVEVFFEKMQDNGFRKFKQSQLDTFKYSGYGMMGQYTEEYLQIQDLTKEKAKYLKKINDISLAFFKKYEPYLKEGTWSDSNYLSDNSYYFGAKEVAKQGAIPKLTYNISVVDLDTLDKDYHFDIADSSYIEDIETFGINEKTGLPNRLKVLISGITYDLDIPTQNTLQIQNYTTQFEDLFQQVSASVQSLSFNENIYKRSSNFTSAQNISEESLQGGLSENQLTLIETEEKNIELDYTGQSGSDINNHANKYKLSGEGLFFSNNGGQSWNVGVTPKGINADYIKVGSLDASKISIIDGNYLYFLWDKGGITAYRTPQATGSDQILFQDFARFNKYGLSLVENGKIRLRAGYEFIGEKDENGKDISKGDIVKEQSEITPETKIGFYLYNDSGEPIFYTRSGSGNESDNSAKLSLRGEIYVTDTNLSYTNTTNSYINYSHIITFTNTTIKEYNSDSIIVPSSSDSFRFDEFLNTWDKYEYHSEAIYLIKQYLSYKLINNKTINTLENDDVKIEFIINPNTTITLNEKFYLNNSKYNPFKTYKIITIKISDLRANEIIEYSENAILLMTTANKIYDGNLYNTKKIKIYKSEDMNKKEEKSKNALNIQNIEYWKKNSDNSLSKYVESLCQITSIIFYKKYEFIDKKEEQKKDGASVLYINNPTLNSSIDHRLFCCATNKQINDDITNLNIFTILKNGKLFIGGEIVDNNDNSIKDLTNMPSEITVKNAGIEITSEGKLFINFNKLATKNDDGEEMSLVDYVAGEIQKNGSVLVQHSHNINELQMIYESGNAQNKVGIPLFGIKGGLYVSEGLLPSSTNKKCVTWDQLAKLFSDGYIAGPTSNTYAVYFNKYVSGELINTSDNSEGIKINCEGSKTEMAGSQMASYGGMYSLLDPIDGGV